MKESTQQWWITSRLAAQPARNRMLAQLRASALNQNGHLDHSPRECGNKLHRLSTPAELADIANALASKVGVGRTDFNPAGHHATPESMAY